MSANITWDEWELLYTPVKNHLDENASFDGWMFGTYGEELDYVFNVHKKSPKTLWTIIDGEDGAYVVSGYQWINRLGYVVTLEEHDNGVIVFDEREVA